MTTKEETKDTAPPVPADVGDRKMDEVTTAFKKFEVHGDSLAGSLSEKGTQTFANGVVGRYKVIRDDDVIVGFLGNTSLDDLLESVEIGTFIRVTYTGDTQTKSAMKMKVMKLEVEAS